MLKVTPTHSHSFTIEWSKGMPAFLFYLLANLSSMGILRLANSVPKNLIYTYWIFYKFTLSILKNQLTQIKYSCITTNAKVCF